MMSTKGIAMHRNIGRHGSTGGRPMRVPGTDVVLTRCAIGTEMGWRCVVANEPWLVVQNSRRVWQGTTPDRLAETPRFHTQAAVVHWVLRHHAEWTATLQGKRAPG